MITVKYGQDSNGIWMKIDGHAGKAPRGKDLVCAAASALTMTLDQALEDRQDLIFEDYEHMVQPGSAYFAVTPTVAGWDIIYHVFDTIFGGFRVLCACEPKFVQIFRAEGREQKPCGDSMMSGIAHLRAERT